MSYVGTIGDTFVAEVYRNAILAPVYSITINGAGVTSKTNVSVDFSAGNTYYVTVRTTGNTNNGTYVLTLTFY